MDKLMDIFCSGDIERVISMVRNELSAGRSRESIIEDILVPSIEKIGVYFENDDLFVPEVLTATRVIHAVLRFLNNRYDQDTDEEPCSIVIGTVAGDLHDIGKNIL